MPLEIKRKPNNKICPHNSATMSKRIKVTSHALRLKETMSHFIGQALQHKFVSL